MKTRLIPVVSVVMAWAALGATAAIAATPGDSPGAPAAAVAQPANSLNVADYGAIGDGRSEIEAQVARTMQRVLDSYLAGVRIQGVAIKKADPPQSRPRSSSQRGGWVSAKTSLVATVSQSLSSSISAGSPWPACSGRLPSADHSPASSSGANGASAITSAGWPSLPR